MKRDKRHSDDQTKRSSLKKEDPWAYMFEAAKQFTPDFMNEREQDSEAPVNWVDEK